VFLVFARDNGAMGKSDLLTTGEVARLLGVSRQHVVDLCDRGELSCVRVGSHRRVPSSEVDRARGALTRDQERALWLHQALLGELLARPDEALGTARGNIERWLSAHRRDGATAGYLAEWSRIIDSGPDAVADALTSRSPEACELRQNSPFAGVLPDDLRARVLRSFNRHWSRDHAAA
jgi:excisionase family DNA binding protein